MVRIAVSVWLILEKKEDAPAVVAMIPANRLLILNASLRIVKRSRQANPGSVSNVQNIPVGD